MTWGRQRFVATTRDLGFADTVARGADSLVAARLLVQTGNPLAALTALDLDEFEMALGERDQRAQRPSAHYRRVLFTTHSKLCHLGILDRPPVLRPPRGRQTVAARLANAGSRQQSFRAFRAAASESPCALHPA